MNWVDILTSGGVGSIIGFAGSFATKFVEMKDKKNEREHEQRMSQIRVRELQLEQNHELAIADKQIERAQVEGELKIEGIEADAFVESQRSIGRLTGWLRFVRPLLTFYLLILSTGMFFTVWRNIGGLEAFSPEELKETLDHMIKTMLFLTVTAVTWWFGSRSGNIKK